SARTPLEIFRHGRGLSPRRTDAPGETCGFRAAAHAGAFAFPGPAGTPPCPDAAGSLVCRTQSVSQAGYSMSAQTYDAIVVGSGISGGWAAKELTERGLRVLLLERGRNVEHIKDSPNALKGPWEIPHRGRVPIALREKPPVLRRDYVLNEVNYDWWAHEDQHPYIEIKPFDWFRGYHVGGRSLTWGRQSYRWSDIDFEANAREGIAVDWPIRYKDIAPWYDHVERFAGISGSLERLEQLPDGEFLPPMPLNVAEQHVADGIRKAFNDQRRMIPGRVANLSRPHNGRSGCQYRNKCSAGCPWGAYFSTQSATLPAAMATG